MKSYCTGNHESLQGTVDNPALFGATPWGDSATLEGYDPPDEKRGPPPTELDKTKSNTERFLAALKKFPLFFLLVQVRQEGGTQKAPPELETEGLLMANMCERRHI